MKKDAATPRKKHPVRNAVLLALAALLVVFAGYRLVSGYVGTLPKLAYAYGNSAAQARYPACKFAVISDLHYYDTSLGDTGQAFEAYLNSDRKLLRESDEILNRAIDGILGTGVQFVLVSGDLTKDGERVDHEKVAAALSRLTAQGIKVFVVPGNHDINNGWSYSFEGNETYDVPSVTAEDFASIYAGFGYGEAIERDSGSLSYVAEPVPGLWLVGLDACRYLENKPDEEHVVAGRFTQARETWLEGVLRKADESGKAVAVLMHHGLVEHWKGQESLHPEYLVEDYKHIGEMLASWNARLAFTGHYHAQDAAMADFGEKGFLIDMETGSLVTSPCPYRVCSIGSDQVLRYSSALIAPALRPGTGFERDSLEYLRESVEQQAFGTLKEYFVADADATAIAKSVAAAFTAHYAGDEDPAKALPVDEGSLGLWSRVVLAVQRYVLDGLWNDPSLPHDNDGAVSLLTGADASGK